MSNFDSSKVALRTLLDRAHDGKLQLPDFQRGWVWDDERIKSLLASVSRSFPIGAIMLLETGGKAKFQAKPLEGTPRDLANASKLILDGQQRLTSLYQALRRDRPVNTKDSKNKPSSRWYYIDMKKSIEPDSRRDSAILSVPIDRILRGFRGEITLDVSTPTLEYKNDLFPVHQILNASQWRVEYEKFWGYSQDKIELYNEFEISIIECFKTYHIPVIEMDSDTDKEAVCLVFEKVNTGGVPLTVFDLLTASFSAENFRLRDDWERRIQSFRDKPQHRVLHSLPSDHFLQCVSLLVTYKRGRSIGCYRRDILELSVSDWTQYADRVCEGFIRASRFLHTEKIFRREDLPYPTQLVPLAAILTELDSASDSFETQQIIRRWYWCGVLGELYRASIESRFARDLPEVVNLVRGKSSVLPLTIQESNFRKDRLATLKTRRSAAYKGIYALLMQRGARDFRNGTCIESHVFFEDAIEIHHIFPKRWCRKNKISVEQCDSIINKTAISARTNRMIGGKSPSDYLQDLNDLKSILESHCIQMDQVVQDQFSEFWISRERCLLELIERATGKSVVYDPESE